MALFGEEDVEQELTEQSLPAVLRKAEAWAIANLTPRDKPPPAWVYEI